MSTNPYDQIPYPNLSYTSTHPDRLAGLALLLGMRPAPVTGCRVLELGCAGGGNLIPMADALRQSEFVGIDYSERQVAAAQATAAELGLTNISFHARDIRQAEPSLGLFDYVIAHGVYSWVADDVRDCLLALCRANLAPNGVAYVSYNTYPGWHMLAMVREMMRYHTRRLSDPISQANEAGHLINFLVRAIGSDESAYAAFLSSYHKELFEKLDQQGEQGESLLLHDELEANNTPVYFHEFMEHAGRHGLQFLAEADFSLSLPLRLPADVLEEFRQMAGSVLETEQYLDFLRNQTFRRTLLCHQEVALQRSIRPDAALIGSFCLDSRARPLTPVADLRPGVRADFRAADGATLTTDHPASKAALYHLSAISPQVCPFDELLQAAKLQVYGSASPETTLLEEDARLLALNLLKGYSYSRHLVSLHAYRPQFSLVLSDRPQVPASARLFARQGHQATNLRHERVTLDGPSRLLLPLLDGRHSRADLIDHLARERNATKEQATEMVDSTLEWLAAAALLKSGN
jgi:cyclopropane fatty-acyl-phospholipid synthase-like methyltransferase/methyltransferase-like protein